MTGSSHEFNCKSKDEYRMQIEKETRFKENML